MNLSVHSCMGLVATFLDGIGREPGWAWLSQNLHFSWTHFESKPCRPWPPSRPCGLWGAGQERVTEGGVTQIQASLSAWRLWWWCREGCRSEMLRPGFFPWAVCSGKLLYTSHPSRDVLPHMQVYVSIWEHEVVRPHFSGLCTSCALSSLGRWWS
jgi:hypothetical protein